jgi:hypothetical protein
MKAFSLLFLLLFTLTASLAFSKGGTQAVEAESPAAETSERGAGAESAGDKAGSAQRISESSDTATFNWKMLVYDYNTGASFRPDEGIVLRPNGSYALKIETETSCYCYVIIKNTSLRISVLGPADPLSPKTQSSLGPVRLSDPQGIEECIVIMNPVRETNLEKLIAAYNADSGKADDLWKEAVRIHQEIYDRGQPSTTLISWGGTGLRGQDKPEGTEYSGKNRYAARLSIKH